MKPREQKIYGPLVAQEIREQEIEMAKKITRQMLVDEINKRHPETSAPTGSSFAARGNRERWTVANCLLGRLQRGLNPTIQEVVGYFGKGARFEA